MNPSNQTSTKSKKAMNGQTAHVHTDLESMTDQIRDRYEDLIENATTTRKTSFSLIKKYPFYTLAGLVAVGAAATLYLKKRRS